LYFLAQFLEDGSNRDRIENNPEAVPRFISRWAAARTRPPMQSSNVFVSFFNTWQDRLQFFSLTS